MAPPFYCFACTPSYGMPENLTPEQLVFYVTDILQIVDICQSYLDRRKCLTRFERFVRRSAKHLVLPTYELQCVLKLAYQDLGFWNALLLFNCYQNRQMRNCDYEFMRTNTLRMQTNILHMQTNTARRRCAAVCEAVKILGKERVISNIVFHDTLAGYAYHSSPNCQAEEKRKLFEILPFS